MRSLLPSASVARFAGLSLLAAATFPPGAQAATVHWTGAGDGTSWSDRLNWEAGFLPGADADVVIEMPADITVVLTGTVSIRSLNCQAAFHLNGSLTLNGGSSMASRGMTINGSLYAKLGAKFTAHSVANITAPLNRQMVLQAEGVGSEIDLSGVTVVDATAEHATLDVQALAGGGCCCQG